MKKQIILLLSLGLMVSMAHAGTVAWSGGNYNTSVKGVDLAEGWLVVLYKDVDNNNSDQWFNELKLDQADWSVTSLIGTTADDEVIDVLSLNATLANPISTFYNFSKGVTVEDSIDIYTVLFNSTTVGSATSFIVADSSTIDSGTGGTGAPVGYNIGSTFSGEWQAIPEPTVAAFIGVFGGGMLLARRLFSKKA